MALVCETCNMRLAEDANSLKPQDILTHWELQRSKQHAQEKRERGKKEPKE